MRERRTAKRYGYKGSRITPAYAGKTVNDFGGKGRREDHPRVCGKDAS